MPRWEYAQLCYETITKRGFFERSGWLVTLSFSDGTRQELNPTEWAVDILGRLGDEGWELAGTMMASHYLLYYTLKRPKP